ncbi:MAG: helicase-related protein, partial [Enterococcus aquimarinus]
DLSSYKSVLIILNTKKAVLTLYEELKKVSKAKIFYLTTNLCAAHRIEIINEIKDYTEKIASEGVSDSEKIIVVSTQLVEAGVDFDFNVVYRSLSGVDSLIQAAGRCNRNGKLTRGLFKIFK